MGPIATFYVLQSVKPIHLPSLPASTLTSNEAGPDDKELLMLRYAALPLGLISGNTPRTPREVSRRRDRRPGSPAGCFGNRRIVRGLEQFYVLHPPVRSPSASRMRSPSSSMSGSATQIDIVAANGRLVADRLIRIEVQHLPGDAGVAAAEEVDVVDALDQHDEASS
jgi:hypothetical protein